MSAPAPDAAKAPPPRRRFYRRRRFWAWSGLGVLGVVLAALVLLYWLLQTVAGRDVLLAQIVSRLPVNASLSWEKVEGPIAGPLTIHNLDFRYDDYRFTAERAYLDPDIRPLLGKRLRLDAFELTNAHLNLVPSDEPFELPRWPDVLPAIEMPLAIQADTIVVDGLVVTSGNEHLIDIRSLRGGIDIATGSLHAEQLQVDSDLGIFSVHGDYVPADDYRSDLIATAVLPAPPGQAPARFGLIAKGDLSRMDLAIGGRAPEPLRATVVLGGDEDAPAWQLRARSDGLDPALLTGQAASGEPYAFALAVDGLGGRMDVSGEARQGDLAVTIAPSKIHLEDQVLVVEPLLLEGFDGSVRLQGRADFTDPENASFRMSLNARELKFTGTGPDAPTVGVDAALGLAGTLKRWAAYGEATLQRGAEQATLDLDIRGDDQRARIHALRAAMPTGTLDVTGEAGWVPQLAWDVQARLQGFDPGYFLPDWDGRVDGRLASQGHLREDGGIKAGVTIEDLGGRLRGRPLDGSGQLDLDGDAGKGRLALSLGSSRVRAEGRFDGERIAIDADLQPLQLDDLLPGAAGRIAGTLRVTGTPQTPDITADISGSALSWDTWRAESIALRGRLPWRGDGGDLLLQGSALEVGIPLQRVRVHARGAVANLQLEAEVDSPEAASIALDGTLRQRGQAWDGTLAQLRIDPVLGDTWTLQAPATFAINGPRYQLQPACLSTGSGDASATLCAEADWPRQGLSVRSERLPLALVHDWLPRNEGRAILLRGDLGLDAQLRPQGNRWTGQVRVTSPEGGLRLGDRTRREILRYDQFSIDLTFDPQAIQGRLGVGFQGDGYVDASFDTGWDDGSALTGNLYMYMSQLFWLELFSPDLVRPRGVVRGHVSVAGTRSEPAMGGQLLLEEFQGELPVLGLNLSEGKGSFDAQPDGSASITASVKSGEGTLTVDGGLSWYGEATPLQLNIRGDNVLVSDTAMLHAVAAPDLQFSIVDRTMLLRGEVNVPTARIDLERFDSGISPSDDVVVVDPVDPEDGPSAPLDLDLALVLGDGVQLSGFGLDGTLAGRMQVRARPGRDMTATGVLEVGGEYKAYGQELAISRGQLTWSNNLVTDPRINLRAERRINDITAGIDVTGNAEAPRVDVWSDPAMPQSEALSYLMLGRSLAGATSDQAQQVTAASAAMSAGTGLLAARLGASLGFDDAGVTQSRALGGSVVGVGKYLSPKLYVGYGVSMVGSGQVLILKYLLRKGFDIEIESSTVENRGSLNWRREK